MIFRIRSWTSNCNNRFFNSLIIQTTDSPSVFPRVIRVIDLVHCRNNFCNWLSFCEHILQSIFGWGCYVLMWRCFALFGNYIRFFRVSADLSSFIILQLIEYLMIAAIHILIISCFFSALVFDWLTACDKYNGYLK